MLAYVMWWDRPDWHTMRLKPYHDLVDNCYHLLLCHVGIYFAYYIVLLYAGHIKGGSGYMLRICYKVIMIEVISRLWLYVYDMCFCYKQGL